MLAVGVALVRAVDCQIAPNEERLTIAHFLRHGLGEDVQQARMNKEPPGLLVRVTTIRLVLYRPGGQPAISQGR